MINKEVRFANGILRFARYVSLGLIAKARGMNRVADDVKRPRPSTPGEHVYFPEGFDDKEKIPKSYTWEKNRDKRLYELGDKRLKNELASEAMMEYMLLGTGLEDMLFEAAQNVFRNIKVKVFNLAKQLHPGSEESLDFTVNESDYKDFSKSVDTKIDELDAKIEKAKNDPDTGLERCKKNWRRAEMDLQVCKDKIAFFEKKLDKGDELSDDEEREYNVQKKNLDKLQSAADDAKQEMNDAEMKLVRLQQRRERFLMRVKPGNAADGQSMEKKEEAYNAVMKAYNEFREFVENPGIAKRRIYDYLVPKSSMIFGSISNLKVESKVSPEDLMHSMALALYSALHNIQNALENLTEKGIMAEMKILAKGGTVEGVYSVDEFLRTISQFMKDAVHRVAALATKSPGLRKDVETKDGEAYAWEDLMADPHSFDPSRFEDYSADDALNDFFGGEASEGYTGEEYQNELSDTNALNKNPRRKEMLDAFREAGLTMLAGNPFAQLVFNSYLDAVGVLDVLHSQKFNLDNEFYVNLLRQAKNNPELLEQIQQTRLSPKDRELLNTMQYSQIIENPAMLGTLGSSKESFVNPKDRNGRPYELSDVQREKALKDFDEYAKLRIVDVGGRPVLLKDWKMLKMDASREVVPLVRQLMPKILYRAILNLANSKPEYQRLKELVKDKESLADAFERFFRGLSNENLSDETRKRKDREKKRVQRQKIKDQKETERLLKEKGVTSSYRRVSGFDVGFELRRLAALLRDI